MRRAGPILAAALALAGCGLRPLYAGGGDGPVARTLESVTVAPIPGRVGWLVYNDLQERLHPGTGDQPPLYRLEVELDDTITQLGIRGDRAATRERRTLRARYRLVEIESGTVVLDATAGSDAGIDVVGSEYATVAAEQTAAERLSEVLADQIVGRLGMFAARTTSAR
jgi:LPS-assembly lipoprotein